MPYAERRANFWQDWANLALAVWLVISPWVARYVGVRNAAWDAWAVGAVVAVVSVAAIVQYARWQEWVNVVAGLWLVISPWALAFADQPPPVVWNFILVGGLTAVFAGWDLAVHRAPPPRIMV